MRRLWQQLFPELARSCETVGLMPTPSATAPTQVYGGVPADERRAQRRARLMAAAFELLGTAGWSGTTVRAVCAEAKLTPRFFYESFEDLDTLAVAVFDELIAETTQRVLAAVAASIERDATDRRAHAHAAIGTFVTDLTDDPRRARVAFVEALGNERLARRRLDAMRTLAQLIALRGRESFGAGVAEDGLVEVTSALLAGGLAELLIVWLDGSLPVTREELVEDCAELFVATGESAARIAQRRAAAATLPRD